MKTASGRKAKSGVWVRRGASTWILGPPCSVYIVAGHYKHCLYMLGIITRHYNMHYNTSHRAAVFQRLTPTADVENRFLACASAIRSSCALVSVGCFDIRLRVASGTLFSELHADSFGHSRAGGPHSVIRHRADFISNTLPHISQCNLPGCSCGKPCQAMPAARGGVNDIVPLTETDLRVAVMPPYAVILSPCVLPCAFSRTHCFLRGAPRLSSVSAGGRIRRKCCPRFAASAVRDLDPRRSRRPRARVQGSAPSVR